MSIPIHLQSFDDIRNGFCHWGTYLFLNNSKGMILINLHVEGLEIHYPMEKLFYLLLLIPASSFFPFCLSWQSFVCPFAIRGSFVITNMTHRVIRVNLVFPKSHRSSIVHQSFPNTLEHSIFHFDFVPTIREPVFEIIITPIFDKFSCIVCL